jgi:anti-sigma regulatory factor (Ser/Thr protein kinase)
MVRDALAACREIDVCDTAELLTSELVTNALLHAGTDVTVHVEDHGASVRIAVEDGSDDEPTLGELDSIDLGGRGLPLVAAMARSWGWDPLPHGKRVWFEV